MLNLCLYSTVYNNVQYVERSISSVWRPDAEIVIVDSFSTDGTYEKLLSLKKDFNLRLYRYKCSRGLGRQIALTKCLENSITAYFDMDTVYYKVFHQLIDWATQQQDLRILVPYVPTYIAKRETILKRGGWRDLNYLEDNEMNARIGFDLAVPVIIGENAYTPGSGILGPGRELRYGKISRLTRIQIDRLRAQAPSWYRMIIVKDYIGMFLYPLIRLIGPYKNRIPDNSTWIELAILARSVPLKEMNIDERYFIFVVSLPLLKLVKDGEKTIENKITKLASRPLLKITLQSKSKKLCYIKDITLIDKNIISVIKNVEAV